jgi:hypothetical protein
MLIGPSFILGQEAPIGKSICFLGFNKESSIQNYGVMEKKKFGQAMS